MFKTHYIRAVGPHTALTYCNKTVSTRNPLRRVTDNPYLMTCPKCRHIYTLEKLDELRKRRIQRDIT